MVKVLSFGRVGASYKHSVLMFLSNFLFDFHKSHSTLIANALPADHGLSRIMDFHLFIRLAHGF